MAFIEAAVGHVIGVVFQLIISPASRDRLQMIVNRRIKLFSLAKEMKSAGVSQKQLRRLDRQLADTSE